MIDMTIKGETIPFRAHYHDLVRTDVMTLVPDLGGTLLDVGGGVGRTALAIKKAGRVGRAGVIDLVEPSSIDEGLDFFAFGDLEDPLTIARAAAENGPFTIILCLDILEHLRDPWRLVQQLHQALTPGGMIVASIPNMRYYQASLHLLFGKWELQPAGIRDHTHLRWFVKKTAIELMTSSGLVLHQIVGKPGGGEKIRYLRAATLGLLDDFTNLQYLISVTRDQT